MSFDFTPAAPVTRNIAGRAKEENPFTETVKSIANKIDPATGKATALAFLMDAPTNVPEGKVLGDDEASKAIRKAWRKLSEAGPAAQAEPPVSVNKDTDFTPVDEKGKPIKGKVRITFWTGSEQKRPRKAKDVDPTAEATAALPVE